MYRVKQKIDNKASYGSLGIQLGMPRETVSRIFNGKQKCSKPYALAICSILNKQLDELFEKVK